MPIKKPSNKSTTPVSKLSEESMLIYDEYAEPGHEQELQQKEEHNKYTINNEFMRDIQPKQTCIPPIEKNTSVISDQVKEAILNLYRMYLKKRDKDWESYPEIAKQFVYDVTTSILGTAKTVINKSVTAVTNLFYSNPSVVSLEEKPKPKTLPEARIEKYYTLKDLLAAACSIQEIIELCTNVLPRIAQDLNGDKTLPNSLGYTPSLGYDVIMSMIHELVDAIVENKDYQTEIKKICDELATVEATIFELDFKDDAAKHQNEITAKISRRDDLILKLCYLKKSEFIEKAINYGLFSDTTRFPKTNTKDRLPRGFHPQFAKSFYYDIATSLAIKNSYEEYKKNGPHITTDEIKELQFKWESKANPHKSRLVV